MQIDRRTAIAGLASVGATIVGGAAFAQASYPSANVRLIVPFAAGGGADTFARLFSDRLGRLLGQSVIVDNRGGGGGITAGLEVSRAPADGYTLIFHSPTSGVTGPLTRRTRPFDPVSGFAPISILTISPLVLAVSNKAKVNSLAELVAKARANPGKLTYGSSGLGGVPHLSCELLKMRAGGLDIVHAPYRGGAPAIQDVIAGNIDFIVDTPPPLLQHHREGNLKIIAILGDGRLTLAPEIPTAREAGLDVVTRIIYYISAPPGTPGDRLNVLAKAAREIMSSADMSQELQKIAFTPVIDSGPEHASRFIADQVALWEPVIAAAKIQIE
ncbi:tripartite tricarboxylate transporter family receptor [Variibacter gotjawalensis]|uniref:Tripartite tricarboxylate transporter family receptor n=1 Tax=Variibacter gotjawalensis TaxID=1333996 RepID=A0A0S3PU57_9BRAD|nr:tripartite tricarboxylate transporter substrate binding protein [Variibacter gotjawalensis]NIK49787.1 tripartite-type tricarboxylate transporter receptor subunit TctC [Variibacter gotjawalensis]RZS45791.1 tripartite-type tricarboxylate transporter receptor subunit TctC [Variibacter gotjawalensis]BAT59464.1 tripartite tricarboxylate transporter family receptor [Variibacter gotjawalensis]